MLCTSHPVERAEFAYEFNINDIMAIKMNAESMFSTYKVRWTCLGTAPLQL